MTKGIEIIHENQRRIVKGIGCYEPKPVEDLRKLVKNSAKTFQNKIGFKFKNADGSIGTKTYRDFDGDIDKLGTALMDIGLKGAPISIISENRYEWGVCYFSIINGTGVGVPLDKYLPKNEVENLVNRAKVRAIFYSKAFHGMMLDIAKTNTMIQYYICMDALEDAPDDRFLSLPKLFERGASLLEKGNKSFVEAPIDREALSILLFTSGTTHQSKGVMLSHANIASNVTAISGVIEVLPDDVHLSLLPLHHTFENSIGLMFMVHMGVCIAYCEGIKHIAQNIHEFGVSILVAVPAIFEAIYNKLQEGIAKQGKTKLVKNLMKVASGLRKVGIDVRRTLFKSILKKLGPRLRLFVSGAAPMREDIINGFQSFGMLFLQGYGLTETAPVISATNNFANIPGTIGVPIYGVEVTLDTPDENGMGEIMARGGNIMLGYYEDALATEAVMETGGWFKTGDLGTIDENGIIRITGRVKSMIVFTNGKKAFPEEYESLLNQIPGIKESYVWGNKAPDGDIQVCAELVIDSDYFKNKAYTNDHIADDLDYEVKKINKTLPQYKIIRYFLMSTGELIKTTKLSIRRPLEYDKILRYLDKKGLEIRKLHKGMIEA